MRVAFRVDASFSIGIGHVMRCLALADALNEQNHQCVFLCRDLPGNIAELIRMRGYATYLLQAVHPYLEPRQSDDYPRWRQVDEDVDAKESCATLAAHFSHPDYLVLDHYGFGALWESAMLGSADKILVVDDLLRDHHADVVVDQTLGRLATDYQCKTVLAGSDYALLRPLFNDTRERRKTLTTAPSTHRLLLSMGGVDGLDITGQILRQFRLVMPEWIESVDIVLREQAPHYFSVAAIVDDLNRQHGSRFHLHRSVNNMAELMSKCTLAIGAPGVTTWERACLGIPSVLIPIAENQVAVAAAVAQAGIAQILQPHQLANELFIQLDYLRQNWLELRKANYLAADGLGARRVALRMQYRPAKDGLDIFLIKASPNHTDIVFQWQCHPDTRRYARNPQPPSWQQHQHWMQAKLADPDCYFYIINHGNTPAGVIRLERRLGQNEDADSARACYEISLFIAPDKMRLGLAKSALLFVQQLHCSIDLLATVLDGNTASHALFIKTGFSRINSTEYHYRKSIQ